MNSTISDADILSMSITASAKKRKRTDASSLHKTRLSFDLRKGGKLAMDNSPLSPLAFEAPRDENYNPQTTINYSPEHIEYEPFEEDTQEIEVDPHTLSKNLRAKLADALQYQLVDVINNGNLKELLDLHGIGNIRASRIIAAREVQSFATLHDLEKIGMNRWGIKSFVEKNILKFVDVEILNK